MAVRATNRNLNYGLKFNSASTQYGYLSTFPSDMFRPPNGAPGTNPLKAWTIIVHLDSASDTVEQIFSPNKNGAFTEHWGFYASKSTANFSYRNSAWGQQSVSVTGVGIIKNIVYMFNPIGNATNQALTIYGNGVLGTVYPVGAQEQYHWTGSSAAYPNGFSIGRGVYAPSPTTFEYCNASLHDIKIFNRALTEGERVMQLSSVAQLMPSIASNCVAHWKFDNINGKILTDSVGGYDITLTNFTDTETASNGSPQSGNTAWVDAYTNLPITS